VKTTESGGPCDFGAGKLIKSHKRHAAVDTLGLMVGSCATSSLMAVMPDQSWRGALKGDWRIAIIKWQGVARGFEVLPRRWVIERALVWLGLSRRLAKDWETSIASAQAWLLIARIRILIRRSARFRAGPVELCVGL
jgi:transposase